MIDLEQYLYDKLRPVFDSWEEDGIYAVSFFVYSNELFCFRGYSNVTHFAVSYNTERDCKGAARNSERRWNYAYWRKNEVPVFDSTEEIAAMDVLFDWYSQTGITDIGSEEAGMDGPVGFSELVEVLSRVARRFQDEGYFNRKFGRPIPILIHDLEYAACTWDATAYANPNEEAEDFLAGNWEEDRTETDPLGFGIPKKRIDAIMAAIEADPELQKMKQQLENTDGSNLDMELFYRYDERLRMIISNTAQGS